MRIALLLAALLSAAFLAATPPAIAENILAPAPHRLLYTCGMHPQILRDAPGVCPICGMDLTPIAAGNAGANDALLTISPAIEQNMGVRTASVSTGTLHRRVVASASLQDPEPTQRDINLRVSGWIERLYANTEGMHIDSGEPLFDLYSPELEVAIGELIAARQGAAGGHGAPQLIYAATRQKLELLGLSRAQVEALAGLERAPDTVTFRSPMTGNLTEKLVSEGAAVQAGQRVLRLADSTHLWVNARVFEQDLPLIAIGQPAVATLPAVPGARLAGTVSFIHPHLDPLTHTALVRMVVPNPNLQLRQGMFATLVMDITLLPHALLVPRSAVNDTGTEQIVFLAHPHGRFEPRRVRLGATGDNDQVEILAGLTAGDTVVTSGHFLLDAESNFRSGLQHFLDVPARDAEAPTPMPVLPSTPAP